MSPRDLIEDAGKTLKDANCWLVGGLAVDAKGKPCEPSATKAKRWDAVGAVIMAAGVRVNQMDAVRDMGPALACLDLCALRLFGRSLVTVNDDVGHAAVMAVFRAAWKAASHDDVQEFRRAA
jgi:hypothetical protein